MATIAGDEVLLLAVAVAVGEPHLGDPCEVERVDEGVDAFGHQMGVVDGERQAQRRYALPARSKSQH